MPPALTLYLLSLSGYCTYKKPVYYFISLFIPIIFFAASLVIGASGCASNSTANSSDQAIKVSPQPNAIAIPFDKIAGKLLETSNFPVFLPAYFPAPYKGEERFLNLESSNNKFTIEIDQRSPGNKTSMYAGTLSGNVGNPPLSPLEKQFISENREVKTIKLANEIEGLVNGVTL